MRYCVSSLAREWTVRPCFRSPTIVICHRNNRKTLSKFSSTSIDAPFTHRHSVDRPQLFPDSEDVQQRLGWVLPDSVPSINHRFPTVAWGTLNNRHPRKKAELCSHKIQLKKKEFSFYIIKKQNSEELSLTFTVWPLDDAVGQDFHRVEYIT